MSANNSPIFIVGAPRSGTTLTARLLGAHTNIFMPGETHFFDDIHARRKSLGVPGTPESLAAIVARLATLYGRLNEAPDQDRVDTLVASGALEDALRPCTTWQQVFAAFMALQMEGQGKTRWGNQVPRDVFQIDVIMTMFPDAKIIGCVRDVRDFLLSYRHKWSRESGETAARLKKLYHPVITSMIWRASNAALKKAQERYPQNVIISRYEDLVENPAEAVERLCAFVGEPFEPQILNTEFSNSSAEASASGIFKSSAGRWSEGLPAADVWLAQHLCKRAMEGFGYPPAQTRPPVSSLTGIILSTPFKLVFALHANRQIRGPLLPYLWKRLKA